MHISKFQVKKWKKKETQHKLAREKMKYNAELPKEWFSNVIEISKNDCPMTRNILIIKVYEYICPYTYTYTNENYKNIII